MRRGEAAVDAPEPPRIAERLGERQRLLEAVQVAPLLAERHQQLAQLEPDVDRLFRGRPGARQMAERRERLLEVGGGRRVRRAARRPRRGSAAPRHRLVPQLTLHRMMSEALDVVVEALAVSCPIASITAAWRARRRASSMPSYATSCVSACLKVYSTSGTTAVS